MREAGLADAALPGVDVGEETGDGDGLGLGKLQAVRHGSAGPASGFDFAMLPAAAAQTPEDRGGRVAVACPLRAADAELLLRRVNPAAAVVVPPPGGTRTAVHRRRVVVLVLLDFVYG